MVNEVAHLGVRASFSDAEAVAGLDRLEKKVQGTARKIEREKFTANLRADLSELKRNLKEAEKKVKEWEKKRGEGVSKLSNAEQQQLGIARQTHKELQAQVAEKEQAVVLQRRLNIESSATEKHLANQVGLQEKSNRLADKAVRLEQRKGMEAAKLQQRYAKLADEVEQANKKSKKTLLSPAVRQRVEIDRNLATEQMSVLRAQLKAMGKEPIDIDVDVDVGHETLGKFAKAIAETTIRIGPLTTTLVGLGRALLVLGPIVSGVTASIVALTGAIGAGLLGTIGLASAGIAGFGLAAIGAIGVLKPVFRQLGDVKKATKAYNDQVKKTGEDSDKAKKKLKELNSVLGHVDDQTVETISSWDNVRDAWSKSTKPARGYFWDTAAEGIRMVDDLMPMFAKNTNETFRVVSQGAKGWMRGLSSGEGKGILNSLFGNFNKSLPNIMRGLGNLGAVVGRILQSFSNHLPGVTKGFADWSARLSEAVQPGKKLDGQVGGLVDKAKQLGRFFMAAGRTIVTVLGGASGEGGSMLDSMTRKLNEWNRALKTGEGRQSMLDFFRESATTARHFFSALAPILKLFNEWITIMRPLTDIGLQVFGALAKIVEIGASFGPLKTLMQGAFILFLGGSLAAKILGVVSALKALKATAIALGTSNVLANIGNAVTGGVVPAYGKTRGKSRAPVPPAVPMPGRRAPAPVAPRTVPGSGRQAGAIKAAVPGIAVTGAAASGGSMLARLAPLAAAAATPMGALALAATAVGAGLAIAAVKTGVFKDRIGAAAEASSKLRENASKLRAGIDPAATTTGQAGTDQQRNIIYLEQARARLAQTKRGTQEYRLALLDVVDAQRAVRLSGQNMAAEAAQQVGLALESAQKLKASKGAKQTQLSEQTKDLALYKRRGNPGDKALAQQTEVNITRTKAQLAGLDRAIARADARFLAATINAKRAQAGLGELVGRNALAMGRFLDKYKNIPAARKLLLTINDEQVAGKIAAISNKLAAIGQKPAVAKILANNDSAKQKLAALEGLMARYRKSNPKTNVGANSDQARGTLNRLLNVLFPAYKKSNPKTKMSIEDKATSAAKSIISTLGALKPIKIVLKFLDGAGGGKDFGTGAGAGERVAKHIKGKARSLAQKNAPTVFNEKLGKLGGKDSAGVQSLANMGPRFGLNNASGPGQSFRGGDPGWHGKNRARDVSGPADGMVKYGRFLAKQYGSRLLELIHTPLGFGIKNGKKVAPYAQADHFDHVHVAYRQGGKWDGSRKVSSPTIMAGEEAPRHPEYFISTNPRDSKRSLGLWQEAGLQLGVQGYHSGGKRGSGGLGTGGVGGGGGVGIAKLVELALGAGFGRDNANIMAAVAMAESSGQPGARGDGGASHGLWQIYTKAHPQLARKYNLFDVEDNAKAARDVYKGQGFSAWTMYKNGGYKKHLGAAQNANPGSASDPKDKAGKKDPKDKDAPEEVEAMTPYDRDIALNESSLIQATAEQNAGLKNASSGLLQQITSADEINALLEENNDIAKQLQGLTKDAKTGKWKKSKKKLKPAEVKSLNAQKDKNDAAISELMEDGSRAEERNKLLNENKDIARRLGGFTKDRKTGKWEKGKKPKPTEAKALKQKAKENKKTISSLTKEEALTNATPGLLQQIAQKRLITVRSEEKGKLLQENEDISRQLQGLQKDPKTGKWKKGKKKLTESQTNKLQNTQVENTTKIGALTTELADGVKAYNILMGTDPESNIERSTALAGITPDLGDDTEAAAGAVGYWGSELAKAKKSKNFARITESATNFKAAKDALDTAKSEQKTAPLDAMAAMASLTPSIADDLQASSMYVTHWAAELQSAFKSGDQKKITTAAAGLAAAQEQVKQQARQQKLEPVELATAQAGGTLTLTDDITALEGVINYWGDLYREAEAAGNIGDMTEALGNIHSGYEGLKQLKERAATEPLLAAQALADLTPSTADDRVATQGLLTYWENALSAAQAIGDNAAIIAAAQNVKTYRDQLKSSSPQLETNSFNQARFDLYRQMGSNFTPLYPGRGIESKGPGWGGAGQNQSVNVTNNFQAPPSDPLIWSRGIMWDLRGAM